MNYEKRRLPEFISRWKFLISSGIFLGIIITGLSLFKKAEFLNLESQEQVADFHFVEGWSADKVKGKGFMLSSTAYMFGSVVRRFSSTSLFYQSVF